MLPEVPNPPAEPPPERDREDEPVQPLANTLAFGALLRRLFEAVQS